MRNLVLVVVVALVGASVYLVSSSSSRSPGEWVKSVAVGDLAPDFQLEDTEGNKVSLSDLRGKVVLVNFWATWCPPCIEEMPSMERLNEVLAGDDFVMLAINTEENGPDIVPAFLKRLPTPFPFFMTTKVSCRSVTACSNFLNLSSLTKMGPLQRKSLVHWTGPVLKLSPT